MGKSCIQYKCVCGGDIYEYFDDDGFSVECTNDKCNTPFSKEEYKVQQRIVTFGEVRKYRGVNYYCYDGDFYIIMTSYKSGVICNSYLSEEHIKFFIDSMHAE